MSASKFTKQRASQIVVQMKDGVGLGRAAQMAGVTARTVYNWRKAGREEGQGAKHDFDRQVETCEAEQLAEAERTVRSILGDREDARALNAATWLLERRLPDEYGRRDEVRIKVESALKDLLDEVQPEMSHGAFDELLEAIIKVHGIAVGDLGVAPEATVH